jgi:hypothetical protein
MIETIIECDIPEEFSATYEAKGVKNGGGGGGNRFYEKGPEETRWAMVSELELGVCPRKASSGCCRGPWMNSTVGQHAELETQVQRAGGEPAGMIIDCISSGQAISPLRRSLTMRPSWKWMRRSVARATSGSWVTSRKVWPCD